MVVLIMVVMVKGLVVFFYSEMRGLILGLVGSLW